ncbi:LysR family transcriptional regulator [Helicobacter jaachi]|uniref:LysR family transcriptional regulator n=1 Tax=Helicobacter jaachi TaxID=1677920 RepID=A0A4U8TDY1_9HELI|nr:LysR family transcriptional regulator [Helicobacter jaachi]TLD96877.1 LysR family transcriptional regulator [Helicobacter jaachi]
MNVFARFWFEKDKKSYIGVGRAELLERIARTGSISKAAKEMGMSYKAAWDSVDIMNKLSPCPLVSSSNGGRGGGGTKLTPLGFEALEVFHKLERVKNIFFDYLDNSQDFAELSNRLSHLEAALKDFKKE